MKKALYSQPNWLSKRTGTYTPPAAPGDISNLAVTATTNSSIAVSWDAPISGGPVSSYQVKVQLAGGDWSALVFSGSSLTTSKITTGLLGNVEYDVRVRATNGGGQSAWLDVTSYTNPNAPTGLVATPSSGNVNLEWDDIAGLTYKVYRNTSNNSGTATLIDSSEAGPEYDDSSVVNGTTYYYWLKATNSAGDSGFSSVVSAMPEAGSTIPPGVPESFAVDSLTDSSISVSWNSPVTGDPVDLYRLRWKNSADTWASVLGTDTTTDLDYIVTGLDDNSEYDIEVRAENAGGNSAYVSLSEILTKPSLPSNFTATSQDEAVDLDWDNVAGITWDVLANSSNDLGTASVIASGLVTNSYTETGLTNGVTRYYWLRAINASGYVGEVTASTTPALAPSWGSNPVITSDADIDNPLVGDTLSVSDTSGATGDPAPTMSYQWQRNSSGWVDISGATSIDYTLSSGDVGYSVRCHVLASNIGGSDDAPSNSTGVIIDIGDPSWNNVALLIQPQGADGITQFFDQSKYNHILTAKGTAQQDTDLAQFAPASILTSDAASAVTVAGNLPEMIIGTADFTLEFSFRYSSLTGFQTLWDKGYTGGGAFLIQTGNGDGKPIVYLHGSAVLTDSSASVTTGTYYNYAVRRSGSALTLWRDGVQVASATNATDINNTSPISIGRREDTGDTGARGNFGYLRLTIGTARTITNPTEEFPVNTTETLSGISLLVRFQTHKGDNDPSTILFQDTACTVPAVTDYDPIAAWRCPFSGRIASQSDTNKQPYLLYVSGVPTVIADGVDDYLQVTLTDSDTQTISFGGYAPSTSFGRLLGYSNIRGITPDGVSFWTFYATDSGSGSSGLPITSWGAASLAIVSASSAYWRVGGSSVTSFDPYQSGGATNLLFFSDNGSGSFDGSLTTVIVSAVALPNADMDTINTYIASLNP